DALAADPTNVLAHRIAASFYLSTNHADRAEPHLRQVVDLTKSTAAALALADYYVARKDTAAAQALLQPLAASPQTAAAASVRLANLDRLAGRGTEAYQRLERILAGDHTNLQA